MFTAVNLFLFTHYNPSSERKKVVFSFSVKEIKKEKQKVSKTIFCVSQIYSERVYLQVVVEKTTTKNNRKVEKMASPAVMGGA